MFLFSQGEIAGKPHFLANGVTWQVSFSPLLFLSFLICTRALIFISPHPAVLFIILFPANYWFPSAEQITVAGWGVFSSGNRENLYKKQVFSRLICWSFQCWGSSKAWLEVSGFISRECTDKWVRTAFHQFLAAEAMSISLRSSLKEIHSILSLVTDVLVRLAPFNYFFNKYVLAFLGGTGKHN